MEWPADGPVIVWLSGGKDSAVTLALAARAIGPSRVIPVHMALVHGLECVEAPIRAQLRLFGVKRRLMVLTHPDAIRLHADGRLSLRAGTGRGGSHRLPELAELARVRARAPRAWCASGEKRVDSLARMGRFAHAGSDVSRETRWLYPLAWWTTERVRALARNWRLPLAPTWGQMGGSSGFRLDANCLSILREQWPMDYERTLEQYPLAEVILRRAPACLR